MKLISFRSAAGPVHIGLVRGDHVVDLTAWATSVARLQGLDMLTLIDMSDEGLELARAALDINERELRAGLTWLPLDSIELTAPIQRPRKNVMCLGRNYAEHAAESYRARGETPPQRDKPAIFTKAPTAVIGPYDDIPFDPKVSEQIDWEGELAIVIGRAGKNIKRERAMSHIFGYMALNDISARDIQYGQGGQFFKGKSLDGTCPTGPWIVTADELIDPDNLELWTKVNGIEKQHANTRSMIIDVAGVIELLSFGLTLEPGDIIATGTPSGVGYARTPREFLKPGDTVEVFIEKIGSIRNTVVQNAYGV